MTALKTARAALAAQITTAVASFPGVDVLPYDPPTISGDMVTVSTAGLTATELRLYVRIYVSGVQSQEGQDRLDDLVDAVEAGGLSDVPGSPWSFQFDERKGAFLMTTTVDYPREDWG